MWLSLTGAFAVAAPLTPGALIEDERNTISVFEAAAPAVVYVTQTTVMRDLFMRAMEVPSGTGTGFVWDEDGHVVTNYHVVAGEPTTLSVTLQDHQTYDATIVGVEPRKDIAVLHIDAPAEKLFPIRKPAKGQSVAVGQKAVAIGNPFGLDQTLTTGVVSALGREVKGIGGVTIRDMIQTDAAINPGNSGGPLLDSAGQLIGMNTMIFSQSGGSAGIGFAVPYSTIARVVPQIIATGRPERLGIGVYFLDDSWARRNRIDGVIVRAVGEGSPAEKAGLRGLTEGSRGMVLGDVIVAIGDHPVHNFDDLYTALDQRKAGDVVDVHIVRDGKKTSVPVEVVVLP